jgi:uncharacterized protein with HEPN domain
MNRDRLYLLHVRDAMARIQSYVGDGRDYYDRDAKTRAAVTREVEIIGGTGDVNKITI